MLIALNFFHLNLYQSNHFITIVVTDVLKNISSFLLRALAWKEDHYEALCTLMQKYLK